MPKQPQKEILLPVDVLPKAAAKPADALSTPAFQQAAARIHRLDEIVALFDAVIASSGAQRHQCSRLVLERHAVALFGTAPSHCDHITRALRTAEWDSERPQLLHPRRSKEERLLLFPIALLIGDPLVVSIGFEGQGGEIDRALQARLHGLAAIYAPRALTLWEIEEDVETSSPLTLKERFVLSMMLSGYACFEIAQRLDCSMDAVSTHVANATGKLAATDAATAIAAAARRGWLHLSAK